MANPQAGIPDGAILHIAHARRAILRTAILIQKHIPANGILRSGRGIHKSRSQRSIVPARRRISRRAPHTAVNKDRSTFKAAPAQNRIPRRTHTDIERSRDPARDINLPIPRARDIKPEKRSLSPGNASGNRSGKKCSSSATGRIPLNRFIQSRAVPQAENLSGNGRKRRLCPFYAPWRAGSILAFAVSINI